MQFWDLNRRILILLLAATLAGCAGAGTDIHDDPPPPGSRPTSGGGILGLAIDDVYRPIASAKIFLEPDGLLAQSHNDGMFQFTGLAAGTYTLKLDSDGHEAAPMLVDVVSGQFTEVELSARRTFSEGSRIITTQYSVFIPCAGDYIVNGIIVGCIPDSSGDTYRPGFTADTKYLGSNVTYLVSEAKMNQIGNYDVQVREDTSTSSGGARYAVGYIRDDDYIKMVNPYGQVNEKDNGQNNNVPWNNTERYATLVFMSGSQRDTFNGISETTCQEDVDDLNRGAGSPVRTCNWRGAGVQFAIKATFIQSLFLGPPDQSIDDYHVLGSSK